MYECFEMHDDWQFADIISQRQTTHWNIGHIMARALTYTCKSSSSGDAVVWRHIKTIVEGGEPYPVHRLAGSKAFWWYCYCWTLYCRAHLDNSSVANAFCMFAFVCFFFIIPFLLGSPFRVLNPPGNRFFLLPLFLPELPLKVVNPSGCSFLPKPPFRVFSLASLFTLYLSFCFFILAIDHRPY